MSRKGTAAMADAKSLNIQVGNNDPKLKEDWSVLLDRIKAEFPMEGKPTNAQALRVVIDEMGRRLDWSDPTNVAVRLGEARCELDSLNRTVEGMNVPDGPDTELYRELQAAYLALGRLSQRNLKLEEEIARGTESKVG